MPDLVNNKMTGFKFIIKRGDPNGVLAEVWQDDIDHVTKKNEWGRLGSWVMMNHNNNVILEPPSDHQEQIPYCGPVREESKKVKSVAAPSKKEGLLSLSEQLEKLTK